MSGRSDIASSTVMVRRGAEDWRVTFETNCKTREESQCTTHSLPLTSSPITPSPHLSLIHHDCKLYCPGAEAVSWLRILWQFLPRGGSHYDGSEGETDHIARLSAHKGTHKLTSFWSVVLHTAQPAVLQTYTAQQRERGQVTNLQSRPACFHIYHTHSTPHSLSFPPPPLTTLLPSSTPHSLSSPPPPLTTHLVSHLDQAAQSEFEYHASLEGDKVPHIFKDEKSRTVVVAVAEIGDYK